jgi:hypothetical protein
MYPRCSPDAAQMYPRCSPDAAQMYPRCSPDAAQMQPRCSWLRCEGQRGWLHPEPVLLRGAAGVACTPPPVFPLVCPAPPKISHSQGTRSTLMETLPSAVLVRGAAGVACTPDQFCCGVQLGSSAPRTSFAAGCSWGRLHPEPVLVRGAAGVACTPNQFWCGVQLGLPAPRTSFGAGCSWGRLHPEPVLVRGAAGVACTPNQFWCGVQLGSPAPRTSFGAGCSSEFLLVCTGHHQKWGNTRGPVHTNRNSGAAGVACTPNQFWCGVQLGSPAPRTSFGAGCSWGRLHPSTVLVRGAAGCSIDLGGPTRIVVLFPLCSSRTLYGYADVIFTN